MPRLSEEVMEVDFDNWPIRYFAVKEATRNGRPVIREEERGTNGVPNETAQPG